MSEKRRIIALYALVAGIVLLLPSAWAQDDKANVTTLPEAKTAPKAASAMEGASEATGEAEKEQPKSESQQWYEKLESAFMGARWGEYDELESSYVRHRGDLSRDQRGNVAYMKKTCEDYRPTWWDNCRSSTAVSFPAKIWGKKFTANYDPSREIGVQTIYIYYNAFNNPKKIEVIVSWRPSYVDNPKSLDEHEVSSIYGLTPKRSKDFGFTLATMGETIVWHELGHNYINISLSIKAVATLYSDYRMLFDNMQEFYADMTALYHTSPKARLFTMMFRLSELEMYDETEPHARGAAHGCGALLLHEMLKAPEKWPSVHWPGKVPEKDIELETIKYVYSHIDPSWTLEEDRNLRDFIDKWLKRNGETALRRKGKWRLSSGQNFNIMATEDRRDQPRRDAWIKQQLEKLIREGKTDDPKIYDEDVERSSRRRIVVEIPAGN